MAKTRDQYIKERGIEGDNISFNLVDEATVKRLQRSGDIVLPHKKVDIPKDERWNAKQMNGKLLQGILNGDSIPKIAKSLTSVIGNNMASANRNARTMTTGAENGGRLDSYKNLESQGVVQKKIWMATADDRTRASHIDIDGEEQDINVAFSNGCMFPGDGKGPADEVWNCRCSMRDQIIGFKNKNGSISKVNYDRDRTLHDEQMEAERTKYGINEKKDDKVKSKKIDLDSIDVTIDDANEDWFEYENANVMAEYIRSNEMPDEDINGLKISEERQAELAKEAELIQREASSNKTEYKTLYRGMTMDEDEVRQMFTPNETYTFDTITATSTDKNIASIYSNIENSYLDNPVPVIFEIQKSDGIYGFNRDGIEIIMPKGAEFKIVRNYMDKDGVVHISLYAKKGNNIRR